jgi:lysylphosphatidylglycerol synthetase-like protein (DUF2156 family)
VRRQTAPTEFRVTAAIHAEAPIDFKECASAAGLEVLFVGCISQVMDHVAKHGKRVGKNPEKHADIA